MDQTTSEPSKTPSDLLKPSQLPPKEPTPAPARGVGVKAADRRMDFTQNRPSIVGPPMFKSVGFTNDDLPVIHRTFDGVGRLLRNCPDETIVRWALAHTPFVEPREMADIVGMARFIRMHALSEFEQAESVRLTPDAILDVFAAIRFNKGMDQPERCVKHVCWGVGVKWARHYSSTFNKQK